MSVTLGAHSRARPAMRRIQCQHGLRSPTNGPAESRWMACWQTAAHTRFPHGRRGRSVDPVSLPSHDLRFLTVFAAPPGPASGTWVNSTTGGPGEPQPPNRKAPRPNTVRLHRPQKAVRWLASSRFRV